MRPKGKLFALLAVFAAIGLVTASGAFTTVDADRTATVDVNGDAAALLQMNASNAANGAYASSGNNQVTIDFNNGNSGLNPNAVTTISLVFNITNQGTQPVDVTVDDSNISDTDLTDSEFKIFHGTAPGDDIETSSETLDSGEQISIGFKIDLTDVTSSTEFDINLDVFAEA